MDLQQILDNVFGQKLTKGQFFTKWYARDLKKFTDEELSELNSTCIFFRADDKILASTLQQRIGSEWHRRDKERRTPKINVVKNKGKRSGRTTKQNRK